ncbi:phosphotransferase [Streptomyces sp. NPDC093591]|uniref:phosphotransferase n=1 Tax=Streptomyces sp. NPDC093591 TaxID=3366044 RepID=UPI0038053AE0
MRVDQAESAEILRLARHSGAVSRGHHNSNYVWEPPGHIARRLGVEPGTRVIVRVRESGATPVVLRTWYDEGAVLDAARGVQPDTPVCLAEGYGFTIHSFVEGEPLSVHSENGKPVDTLYVRTLAERLAGTVNVRRKTLPPLPWFWSRDDDSQGFLRLLANRAEWTIRQPNRAEFGGLFAALGVPEDALVRLGRRVPDMRSRPYGLLHADLHRDNLIVSEAAAAPLVCIDWELASYGDPLHDLATHLVRMQYPGHQWDEVIEAWAEAAQRICPAAAEGLAEDLNHYLDFERAQSVFPDVMRAARTLRSSTDQDGLSTATESVCRALEAAEKPLGLTNVPSTAAVERILYRWRGARPAERPRRRTPGTRVIGWEPDHRCPERPEFPRSAVSVALAAEGAVPARLMYEGTAHRNSVVWPAEFPFPVMVRRSLVTAHRPERGFLSEHAVLRTIDESRVKVWAPKMLALGSSYGGEWFAIHTYAGEPDLDRPLSHPVHGLLLHEADALVDQLCALTQVDYRMLDPLADAGGFLGRLCAGLVRLVVSLPKESQHMARILGLPEAGRLEEILSRFRVSERRPALLHGDLHPWNLVRHEGHPWLTLVDWQMALVGDPLYDLVRHMHLTLTRPEIYKRMFRRWVVQLDAEFTRDWQKDRHVYRGLEFVRSAYVDLNRLMTGACLEVPYVRRAVDSYGRTLEAAGRFLNLPVRPAAIA